MSRGRPGWRRLGIATAAALAVFVAVAAGVLWFVDPRPIAEARLSKSLGRDVRMDRLRLSYDGGLRVTAAGVRVANAPGGTAPDMLRLETLTASVAPWNLLRGEVVLRQVAASGLRLLLEHDPDGLANWKSRPPQPGPARKSGPTILDLALRDGLLTLRTTSGSVIRIAAASATLRTAAADQPIAVVVDGAYDDTPVQASIDIESFDAMRDPARPAKLRLRAKTDSATLSLDGTARDVANFEGVEGTLQLDLSDLGRFVTMFGAELRAGLPLRIAGHATHDGERWALADAEGTVSDDRFGGELAFDEGSRKQPDTLRGRLAFAALDVDALAARIGGSGAASLTVDRSPTTLLDLNLAAETLRVGGTDLARLRLHAGLTAGRLALDGVSFAAAGGTVTAALLAEAQDDTTAARLDADIDAADAEQLLRLAGVDDRVLTGRLAARARLAAVGTTPKQLLARLDGPVVLAMAAGGISREAMALASTDVRALFTTSRGTARMTCLLAVLRLRDGVATLAPLRLRSDAGTLFGGGRVDLPRRTVDLTLKSEANSTGLLSLDVPVHITGSLDRPSLRPEIASAAEAWRARGATEAASLPDELRPMATGSACLR